jgi:outer membrane lipoprotein SlyB
MGFAYGLFHKELQAMSTTESLTSPLIKIAAMAIIISAVVGVGAMTGMLPSAHSSKAVDQPCADCGVIDSIKVVEEKGEGTGAGAIIGGIAGAAVGSQIGRGDGKRLATLAGAAGGAVAGNEIEKNSKKTAHYKVAVRMENGSVRSFTQQNDPGFRPGENVRVVNGSLVGG